MYNRVGVKLNSSRYHKNNNDNQQKAEPATGEIAPMCTVRPCRKGADQKQHEYNQQNNPETHIATPEDGAALAILSPNSK
jgi:hypothetical protein